jgi:ferredoxin
MSYVVTEACIRCKYMDCVDVCPVDCFHEGQNMLVIHPDVCIDCGQCEPECPVQAIVAESDPKAWGWIEVNRTFATQWRNITAKGTVPVDAEDWQLVTEKRCYFSPSTATSSSVAQEALPQAQPETPVAHDEEWVGER